MASTMFEFAADVHIRALHPPWGEGNLDRLAAESGAFRVVATGEPPQTAILYFRAWVDAQVDDEGKFMAPFVQQAVPAAAERLNLSIEVEAIRTYAVCVACRNEADGLIEVKAARTRVAAAGPIVEWFQQYVWTCASCRSLLEGGSLHLAYCGSDRSWGARGKQCPAGCGRTLSGMTWPT